MHFASRITLSGIALSGVAMISFKTLAEASMRLAMSESVLVFVGGPAHSDRRWNKCSAPGDIWEIPRKFVSYLSSSSSVLHAVRRALADCSVDNNTIPRGDWFYPEEPVNRARTFPEGAETASKTRGEAEWGLPFSRQRYTGFTVW